MREIGAIGDLEDEEYGGFLGAEAHRYLVVCAVRKKGGESIVRSG